MTSSQQGDPMVESSNTPQAGHQEPEPQITEPGLPQPDPPTVMQTEPQPEPITEPQFEPDLPPGSAPELPSYSPDQTQFVRMRMDDRMEPGESSYRTTMPPPEAFTFQSPDVLEHDQEDDDNDSMIMIEPCRNFGSYSSWIKQNFSHHVHRRHIEFMNNVLELYDQERLFELYYYQPKQWVIFLGKVPYLKHFKFIIELNLIWTATIHMKGPIDYETYHEIRDDNHAKVYADFKREADILLETNLSEPLPASYSVVHVKTPK